MAFMVKKNKTIDKIVICSFGSTAQVTRPKVDALIQKSGVLSSDPGSLTAEVHDFTRPYPESYFDLAINVKAIQGFNRDSMRQIAKVHYDTLKPSRRGHL
jgi:hypothetical protein